jgi:hypothetical protein
LNLARVARRLAPGSGVVKGLEAVIHECERQLMELRHRTDAAAERERSRLQELRDRTVAQVKEALAAIGFTHTDENGNGGEAG